MKVYVRVRFLTRKPTREEDKYNPEDYDWDIDMPVVPDVGEKVEVSGILAEDTYVPCTVVQREWQIDDEVSCWLYVQPIQEVHEKA